MRKKREAEDAQSGYRMKYILLPDGEIVATGIRCPYPQYLEPSEEVKIRLQKKAEEDTHAEREQLHRKQVDDRQRALSHWTDV